MHNIIWESTLLRVKLSNASGVEDCCWVKRTDLPWTIDGSVPPLAVAKIEPKSIFTDIVLFVMWSAQKFTVSINIFFCNIPISFLISVLSPACCLAWHSSKSDKPYKVQYKHLISQWPSNVDWSGWTELPYWTGHADSSQSLDAAAEPSGFAGRISTAVGKGSVNQ